MYQNDWTSVAAGAPIQADVWIVSESHWREMTQETRRLPDSAPALVLGGGESPAVVVPPRSTRRKTQRAFREAAKMALQLKPERVGLFLDGMEQSTLRAALWGVGQGLYRYRRGENIAGPTVVVSSSDNLDVEFAILRQQNCVRDWINCPSNLKPPARLAHMMQEKSPDAIQWSTVDQKALTDMGAGGILGVGQGSHRPPVMLVGRYEGEPGDPWIALVGKGITFDSGGISLKPTEGMGRMKGDMGGAAAVAGAIRAIAEEGIPVNVLAVLPLAENLPGGGAYRPGDVLTMMDGTDVEVVSTDAEGRLVLADAVTWAARQDVSAIIDIATLTGANIVALGGIRSALIANDAALASMVAKAADQAAEPAWELPHDEDYADFNKTSAADIKNSGGRPAGTITAGLFIGHFAKAVPWVHLDIAGLSFDAEGGAIGAGATGYGVAALVEIARQFGEDAGQ